MSSTLASIDLSRAALVLIELQRAIVARQLAPRTGADVIATSAKLASEFRRGGGTRLPVPNPAMSATNLESCPLRAIPPHRATA